MREFPSSLGLAGSLLIAHPNLLDPNFRRTVLVISAHEPQEGSLGMIVNRPVDKRVEDLLPDHPELGALAQLPVFAGGPVSRDQLTFAAFRWESDELQMRTHLPLEEAQEIAADERGVVRAFLGYAGWSQGQLEEELSQHAWLVQRPDEGMLDPRRCGELWARIMREQGPWFRLLASAPEDPSRN